MKDVISVDTIAELFWDGYEHQECDDSCPVAGKYNQAKQALHSLLISKLPEGYLECTKYPGTSTRCNKCNACNRMDDKDFEDGMEYYKNIVERVIDELFRSGDE